MKCMKEEYIQLSKNLSVILSPSVDTRYIVLVSGNFTGTLEVQLAHAHMQVEIIGFIMGKNSEKIHVSAIIFHHAIQTTSTAVIAIFASDTSDILIKNDARIDKKSIDSQTALIQKTLRMSDDTRIRVLPILSMNQENVLASHSALVNGFDPESLRYLMSRGISQKDGERILALGQFRSVAENVSDPNIRQTLYNEWKRFI